jgi:hypothetical protein
MAGVRFVSYHSSSFRSLNVLARNLATVNVSLFAVLDTFADRCIDPDTSENTYVLNQLGYDSMNVFRLTMVEYDIVPDQIMARHATCGHILFWTSRRSNDSEFCRSRSETLGRAAIGPSSAIDLTLRTSKHSISFSQESRAV